MPSIRVFVLQGVVGENQIRDLWVLIIWPLARQSFTLALVNKKISLAKNKMGDMNVPTESNRVDFHISNRLFQKPGKAFET